MSTEAAAILEEELPATVEQSQFACHSDSTATGDDWLPRVPAHWQSRRMRFLLSAPLKYGANESADEEDRNAPRYIRITDIDEDGTLRDHTFKSLPEIIAREYLLEDGDVLFARSGATVGKTFIYDTSWGRAAYAGYLIRARIDKSKATARFVYYYTRSSEYWNWLNSIFIQATIQNVSAEKYANLVAPLPPLSEQRAIASVLDVETSKIDTLVKKKEHLIELLQEKRTALISHAVTKGLNPAAPLKDSGVDWLGQIPAHWSAEKFKHRVWFQEGPGIMAADFHEVGVPLIRIGDLTSDQVELKGTNFLAPDKVARKWAHFQVAENDLLISCSATTGVVSRVGPEAVGAVPYTGIIRLQPIQDRAVSDFIKYVVVSQSFLDQVDSLKSGVAIQHYGPVHLRQVYTAFPPVDEQMEIARQLDTETSRYDALIAKVTLAIERLREYRTALISAAVTGKIDVRREAGNA